MKYKEWIDNYLLTTPSVIGMCREACHEMRAAFPELTLHGGYVHTPFGADIHFWLTTAEGEIVDPTASQFMDLRLEDYEDAHTTEPLALLQKFFVSDAEADDFLQSPGWVPAPQAV